MQHRRDSIAAEARLPRPHRCGVSSEAVTAPLPASDTRILLLSGSLNFITIGVAQSLLGPSLEAIGLDFGIRATTVSFVISVLFLGAAVSIATSGWLVRRFGYRRLLAGALGMMTTGSLLMTLAPNWPVALLAATLIGLGFGLQNVGTNLLMVRSFGTRAGPAVNFLSAVFGIGSVLGPLLVGFFLPQWRLPFLVLTLLTALAVVLSLRIPEPAPEQRSPQPLNLGMLLSVMGFVSVFFFYVSTEVGAASWAATHLTPHFGPEQAAFLTSFYWAAITVGRFIAIPVSARVRPAVLVVSAAAISVPGVLLTLLPAVAPLGYIVMGLAFAPIFPTTLVWIQQTLPGRSETMIPVTMAAANLGPVLTAPLIGFSVTRLGSGSIPWMLLGLAVIMLAVCLGMFSRTRSGPST